MSRKRSELRDKAYSMWERSGRKLQPAEIAKRLGISASMVRKWKHLDAWEAKPSRNRGGQPGNKNAVGNKGGAAPPGNSNAWKNGDYESMWMSQIAVEHKLKLMKMETDPRQILLNEITLLEYREFKMMRYINLIENGWDDKQVEEKYEIYREQTGERLEFEDGMPKMVPVLTQREQLIEKKLKAPNKLERILSIENGLTAVQGRKIKCIALLDQFDRNEMTDEELRLKIQRMQLEVNKLREEAW